MNLVINDFVGDAAFSGFGQVHPVVMDMVWLTDVVKRGTFKEQRNQIAAQPQRVWQVNWKVLDEAARNKLMELKNRAAGRYREFLWYDYRDGYGDYDCTYTDWEYTLSTGDTTTQLQKTYYKGETEEWTEDKARIVPGTTYSPTIKVDNIEKTEGAADDYTLDDETGLITWVNHTPSDGEVVTADYRFYYRVRFATDAYRDANHLPDLWTADDIVLVEVI